MTSLNKGELNVISYVYVAIGELGSLIYSPFSHSICIKPYKVMFLIYMFVVECIPTSSTIKTWDLYIFRLRKPCRLHLSHEKIIWTLKRQRGLYCARSHTYLEIWQGWGWCELQYCHAKVPLEPWAVWPMSLQGSAHGG